jgi:hypothetical protein
MKKQIWPITKVCQTVWYALATICPARSCTSPQVVSGIDSNGQPGLVAQVEGVTVAVYAFDVADNQIKHIGRYSTPTSSGPGSRTDRHLGALARRKHAATGAGREGDRRAWRRDWRPVLMNGRAPVSLA